MDILVDLECDKFDMLAYLQGCSRTHSDLAQFVTDVPIAATVTLLSRKVWAENIGPEQAFLWRYCVSSVQSAVKTGALRAAKASREGAALLSSSTTPSQDVSEP